jgi:hypothetical protein
MNRATALELADWRRATAALYARVRDQADAAAAHALFRSDQRIGVISLTRCIRSGEIALPGNDRVRLRA